MGIENVGELVYIPRAIPLGSGYKWNLAGYCKTIKKEKALISQGLLDCFVFG
jgi:hypothetical protein